LIAVTLFSRLLSFSTSRPPTLTVPSEVMAGVVSMLDTDLVKLTMHCAILRYFPMVEVVYVLTNRTSDKKFSREAFESLQVQIKST
jgi:nicotinic acid phosphoribosyltransferase